MNFTLPPYVPPSRSVEQYTRDLAAYNKEVHERLRLTLEELFARDFPETSIAVLGSDGRYEKSPASPIEFCVYHTQQAIPTRTLQKLTFLIQSAPETFWHELDCKNVDRPGINQYAENPQRIFPTRVTDSTLVYGSAAALDLAKSRLVEEWIGPEGKHLLERVSDKTREAKRIATSNGKQTYKGKPIRHFDLEEGIATFDPENHHLSFKAGPLRLVQYAIARGLMKHARKGERNYFETKGAVLQMPANTRDRLTYLAEQGLLLEPADARTLGEHYDYFNLLYHISENAHLRGQSTVPVDAPSFAKERLSELQQITEKIE
ncbi:hypothetical protein C4580_03075 [Candidatus Woesearchaeota archaeon]|nr:MAG: hypothetical protein C4580_03075 [Candidatus Woesearchaeota archaeon]